MIATLDTDERRLMIHASGECRLHYRGARVEDIAARLDMRLGRLTHILNVWTRRGWWNYESALFAGHITQEGMNVLSPARVAA